MPNLEPIRAQIAFDTSKFTRGLRRASAASNRFTKGFALSFGKGEKSVNNLNRSVARLRNVLITLGLARVTVSIVKQSDAYILLQARLKLVTSSSAELKAVTDALFQSAQDSRASFEAAGVVYNRLARAADSLGLSQSDLITITDTLNKQVVISGTTAQEARGALIQLSQSFASGRLAEQEFRTVSEQLPAVLDSIARGLQITRGEVIQLGRQSLLSAKLVAEAVKADAAEVSREFKQIPKTAGQALTQLQNILFKSIGENTEITKSFAEAFDDLSETIVKPEFQAGLVAIADGIGSIAKTIGATISGLGSLTTAIREAGEAFGKTPIGRFVVGLIQAQEKAASLGRVLKETFNLSGALGFSGGPGIGQLLGLSPIRGVPRRAAAKGVLTDTEFGPPQEFVGPPTRPPETKEEVRARLQAILDEEKLAKAAEKARILREKAIGIVKTSTRSLEDEARILRVDVNERKVLRTVIETENRLRDAGVQNIEQYVSKVRDAAQVIQDLIMVEEKAAERQDRLNDAQKEAAGFISNLRSSQEKHNARVARYIELLNIGLVSQQQFNELIEESTLQIDEVQEQMQEAQEAADQFGSVLANSFAQATEQGATLTDVVNNLAKDLQRLLTQLLITEPLAKSISGAVQGSGLLGLLGIGGGGATGALTAGSAGRLSSAAASDVASLPFFQKGGSVDSPREFKAASIGAFRGARRMQAGGIIGRSPRFGPNEVPIIAHRGEVVLNQQQQAAGGGRSVVINYTPPASHTPEQARRTGSQLLARAAIELQMGESRGVF